MKNKMARAAALAQWICAWVLALCCMQGAWAEEIRDYYSEPGLNPFKDVLNQNLNEHIDPFSGTLQLKYTDISVPGNGGMDIDINRVYVSLQNTSLPLLGINGVGWVMHFGRIVTPQRNANKICGQALYSVTTADNPSLELPDGGRELLVLNNINNDGSLITRSNWKAHCVAGQAGMVVTSPDGTKYTMNHSTFLQGEPSWMTTRIEDVHGNWIRIDYGTNAVGISFITEIYRSEEGTSQPVVTYEYQDQNTAGIKLSAIEANGQRWQYFYEPIPGYLYDHYQHLVAVQRPDGRRWQYAYNPAQQDPDPNDGVIDVGPGGYSLRQMIYPHGATVDYTYQYVEFDPGSALRTTAIQSKTTSGSAVTDGEWTFSFAPHSRPFTTSSGHTLRYDVTTVTAPEAIYRYVHYGKDFAGVSGGGQVSIRPAVVGLLMFKETYNPSNVLLERRGYSWDLRMISSENFWHGAGYRSWWTETETYAPVPTGEGFSRDAGVSGTGYQHVMQWFDHDAYGNPGGVYEFANIADHSSRQTLFTYRNDTTRWIIGLPLTETVQNAQQVNDPSATTVGQITRTYYDHGKLQSENRFGVVTEFTYTSEGDLASVEDARGFTREYSNYRRGIARREELPESVVLTRSVNSTGTLASETNGRGYTTSYDYDDLNRLTSINYPIHADVSIDYGTQDGASRRTLSRNNYRQTELINDFGETIRTERSDVQSGQTIYRTMQFDAMGRQTFVSYPNDSIGLTTTVDALGRITRTQHPDSTAVTYTYNNSRVVVLNERNSRSEYLYLVYGLSDSQREPYYILQNNTVATLIDRDVFSNTTRVLQGTLSGGVITNNRSKTFQYNAHKFLTHVTEPEVGTTVFGHDAVGNVLTETVNSAPATTFTWDGLGRRVGIDYADDTDDVVTVYDRNNNVIELRKGRTRWNYSYDENDNLFNETLSATDQYFGPRSYQLTYAHDVMDVVSSVTYPSGLVVQYAPDAFGRATQVGTFASNVLYHPSGQLSSYTLANGVTTTVALNQRLLTQRIVSGGVVDLTYGYDNAGNVASITDAVVPAESVTNLGYDGLERLSAGRGRWGQRSFTYDSLGNFGTRTTGTDILRYSLDSRARLGQVTRGDTNYPSDLYETTQFAYDVRGNVTSKRSYYLYGYYGNEGFVRTVDKRLRFDAASNLLSAEVVDSNEEAPARRTYAYDGRGMRYAERAGASHMLGHAVYGKSNVLLFEDAFGECARTDYIVLGALNIAKSRDEFASATTDSDHDGLHDCIEVQLGLNPQNASDAAGDLDSDGLSNLREFLAGSSPLFVDTDGDGLSDALEAQHGTDPFSLDGDGDGISDADEIADGRLNPRLADSDHDGVGDSLELQLQSDPSDPLDATEDFDGDGFSNRQESWTGSDPMMLARAPSRGAAAIRYDVGGPIATPLALGRDSSLYVLNVPSNANVSSMVAMNPDGSVRWSLPDITLMTGPATVGEDGVVYYWTRPAASQATQPRSILYAYNPDGSLRWTYASITDYYQTGIALDREGRVLVAGYRQNTSQGVVTTIDRNGGSLGSKLVSGQVLRAPIVAPDGTTYVVSNTGSLTAFNPDHSIKWTYALRSAAQSEMSLGRSGVLYVTDSLGYTYALQANGTLLWERRHTTAAVRSAVVVGNNDALYFGLPNGQLVSLRASDGVIAWSAAISSSAVHTPILSEGGAVYAVTAGGTVAAVGPTGTIIWSTVLGASVSTGPTLARDGTLYVGTLRGQVVTFADNGGGLARSPWPMQRHDNAATSSQCFNSESFSNVTDTDGDHLEDCDELWLGLNPNDPADGTLDLDGDGLSNSQEAQAGTRIDRVDTDGDGLSDHLEVQVLHTNPLSTDSDGDTLPDGYEVQYQFNPLDPADALLDSDNDGFSNRQEMLAGTDPLNMSQSPASGTILRTVTDATFPARQPAAHPGGVIYMNGPSRLEARNLDLSLRWSWPETVEGNVVVGADSLVYAITRVGTGRPRLVALHPNGTLRWSHALPEGSLAGSIDGPVLGNDGSVYYTYGYRSGSYYAVVVALDRNGRQIASVTKSSWSGDAPKRLSVDPQGNLLLTFDNLFSLQPGTLANRWDSGLSFGGGAMSVPVVDSNGSAYVTRPDGLHAISLATGAVQWSSNSVRGQPVLTEDGLIVATCASNNQLCAFDRTGVLAWQMTTSHTLLGSPAVDANNVIHQMTGNGLYLRVSASGLPVGQIPVPTVSTFQYPLILADGIVYLGMPGANLMVLNDANGAVASPWPTKNRDVTSRRSASLPAVGPVPAAPAVSLTTAPPTFMNFRDNRPVSAYASDYTDGVISYRIQWSSNVDGVIGQGASINLQVLSTGSHTITANVTDAAGLGGAISFPVQVDFAPPTLTVISPLGGSEASLPVLFRATSIDAVDGDISDQIVWTSDRDGYLGTGGSFTRMISLGQHRLTLTSTNSVGLTASTFFYSSAQHWPPTVQITSGLGDVLVGTPVTFTATAIDAIDGDLSNQIRWWSSIDNHLHVGSTFTAPALSPGLHHIIAEVVDSHGSVGDYQGGLWVTDPANEPPSVYITTTNFEPDQGQSVTFDALSASDPEDGEGLTTIQWFSHLDGPLGSGSSLTTNSLSVGVHRISGVLTDSGGAKSSSFVIVTVRDLTSRAESVEAGLLARANDWLARSPTHLWHLLFRWRAIEQSGRQS